MSKRLIVNLTALLVVFGGSYSLSAQKSTTPGTGGTCCDSPAKTCYLNLGDGIIVKQTNSYAC
jgi:hypothetical protein